MDERRGIAARLGIALLNLLAPGLGLLRLRRPRDAFAFWLVLPLSAILLAGFWAVAPILSFPLLMIPVAALALAWIGALIGSIWKTWRSSGAKPPPPLPVWARWYAIVGAYLVAAPIAGLAISQGLHRFYKPFYIPSEAMAPTFLKDDRFVASMQVPGRLQRGDVVLFDAHGTMYIKRIAGLPGDRVELRDGVLLLNGRAVEQRFVRRESAASSSGDMPVRRLSEQFPGEASAHEIYDAGPTAVDEYSQVTVRPGNLFVLGDNRDRSADSRVGTELMGVEQVPISDVRGVALYYTYGPSGRSGQRIGR